MALCEYAYRKNGNDDTVRCKLLNPMSDCCGNVKFCRMTGHWENKENYRQCPIRRHGKELGRKNENGKPV